MPTIELDFDLSEIINGKEIMTPSPMWKHQRVIRNLQDILWRHVKSRALGEVCFAPLDVILEDNENRLQPDILFIRKGNRSILQDWVRGVPDMVCEIVSPGTYERDTEVKRTIYERYGVPEYWIVLPETQAIEVLTLENNRYKIYATAGFDGVITSKVIEGLQINIKDIFEESFS